ncbi:MAG: hypothetical protein GX366_02470 [Epulopiscium sp.]|nr:hypothetical protein [Candidatus Epulonipiscium sp.]
MEMDEVRCVNNNNWIWIIIAAFLLSGNFASACGCDSGLGMGGNFFDNIKCSNNSWIIILALLFFFQ